MKTIGFAISTKQNEKRRAILPFQLKEIKHRKQMYFEEGYGEVLGITDRDYLDAGANIASKEEILKKDIICDPKIGDSDHLEKLSEGQMIFGYVHATQNKDIRDKILDNKITALAWEDMSEEGRHVFWRNNELAGEAAIMHAFTLYGKLPYECTVALIGRGNAARGASRILNCLGATIVVYDRNMEKLMQKELANYDVIVNSVCWDISRDDHVIYREDLKKMKRNSMIVDISCDRSGAIESSVPTNINNPTYVEDGVIHYVVDHTPSILFHSASKEFGNAISGFLDDLLEDDCDRETLNNAIIIKGGKILY